MIIEELIEHLQETYHKDDVIAYSLWTRGDVEDVCTQMKVKLNDDELDDVLYYAHHKQDSNIGINWDVLEHYIHEVIRDREDY